MKIVVFGSGYVGLVAAAGFADAGHSVQCIDIDAARVARMQRGEVPFFEPGLGEVLARCTRAGRLTFGTSVDEGHRGAEVFFIAVGTPPLPDGRADVSMVHAAAKTIAETASRRAVIGVKSTVPVGTCDDVQAIVDRASSLGHMVASIPEFLKEGTALADFTKPDRIILGVAHPDAEKTLRELYRPLQLSAERVLVMDRRSSELSKYAANAMLATRISFMNELSRLCDALGADIHAIRRAVGSDTRIGRAFLYAGPGYGGSCFPKDVAALAERSRDAGLLLEVVEAARRANEAQRAYVKDRAIELLGDPRGKKVAVWGVAFKAETDDVRETPAHPLVAALLERGAEVTIHDPEAAENFKRSFGFDVTIADSEYAAAEGADLLVVMTEWRHFRNPDFDRLKAVLRTPTVFDARNIWTTFHLAERGFVYRGIGTRT